jgi:hypothetical protein
VVTKTPIRINLPASKQQLEGVVDLDVVVNPEGKIVSQPKVIDRTGSPDIEQAKEYVRNQVPSNRTSSFTHYQFAITFRYGGSSVTANSNSASANTDSAKQKPAAQPSNPTQSESAPTFSGATPAKSTPKPSHN